ncbi:MAG TPA: arginine--tRNA ligase, partial [Caldithrix abyssi]|nr:arginine--tRNA ligase [Caldithrix abyssi]
MTSEQYIKEQLQQFLTKHKISGVEVILQRPKEKKFGDYTTNLAMQLARHLKKKPTDIAQMIIEAFEPNPS